MCSVCVCSQEMEVCVSEEFVEFVAEGAVAIDVFGHKQVNHRRNLALWDLGVIQAKTRTLRERYAGRGSGGRLVGVKGLGRGVCR